MTATKFPAEVLVTAAPYGQLKPAKEQHMSQEVPTTRDEERVPLQVSWLSENDLLSKAAKLLGYTFELTHGEFKANSKGIHAQMEVGPIATTSGTRKELKPAFLEWDDYMLFTIAQLVELGFELGDLKYCPDCKKLKADCDQERAAMMTRQQEEAE